MGIGSAKRTAAKAKTSGSDSNRASTPVRTRRAARRTPKSGGSPFTTPQSSSKKASGFTSKLPTDQQRRSNGRQTGRNLINWARPRMAEKLLLHIHYEASRHKVALPWDEIAHRFHPGSSGQAVVQHINRLRKDCQAEGHMVPPVPTRSAPGRTQDNKIRGYIRDEDSEDPNDVRAVFFDEHLDDRKFGIPGACVEDYDDVDASMSFDTPSRGAKNESPQSPTPVGRKLTFEDGTRREVKNESSPYGNPAANHGGMYPPPPDTGDESPLDGRIVDRDNMYHSPEAVRGRPHAGAFHSRSFDGFGFLPYGYHHRAAPMSADRPRHPAFTQYHLADPVLSSATMRLEPGMNYAHAGMNMADNLFSVPNFLGDDAYPREPQQIGSVESSSGTHSQSSSFSVGDPAQEMADASKGCVKPVDLNKVPNSA